MLYEELLKNGKVLPGITDAVFKKIMISHKDYLAIILENVLPISKEEIIEKGEFLNMEIPPSHLSLKNSRMDLLLKIGNYYINLEANTSINNALFIRNAAHFSGLVYKEYSRKDKKTLDEILYQVSFNKTKRLSQALVVKLQYWDKELEVGDDNFIKIELNLDFVNNKRYNIEKLSRFEKALLLLVIEDEKEIIKLKKGDSVLEKVGDEIISYSRAKEIVTAYENAMIEENYKNNLAREEGYDIGRAEGHAEGHAEGRAEGRAEGQAEGENNKQIEIAKNMINMGMREEDISKSTGLSIEEINKLN